MLGRVLGGISTSMLFSCFEAWYVYEHCEHYGFPSEWISVTFSQTTFWNGLLAILAGVISNFAAETLGYGPIAPFALAIVPLIFCGLIVTYSWPENFGNRKLQFGASCGQGLRQILGDRQVLLLGLMQTIVESCMYIFVSIFKKKNYSAFMGQSITGIPLDPSPFAGSTTFRNGFCHVHGVYHDWIYLLHLIPVQRAPTRRCFKSSANHFICGYDHLLRVCRTSQKHDRHDNIVFGLFSLGNRHWNVFSRNVLLEESNHSGESPSQRDELVSSAHECDNLFSFTKFAHGCFGPRQANCLCILYSFVLIGSCDQPSKWHSRATTRSPSRKVKST